MYVEVRTVSTDAAEALQSYIERRLRFLLSRFGEHVGRVSVTVSRDNGRIFTCRIDTEMLPFGAVSARETDLDLFAAVDRATGKLGRLFKRELERAREIRTSRESIRLAA
jgi:ribosomal subunit interface protein